MRWIFTSFFFFFVLGSFRLKCQRRSKIRFSLTVQKLFAFIFLFGEYKMSYRFDTVVHLVYTYTYSDLFYPQFARINKRLIVLIFKAFLSQWKGIVCTVLYVRYTQLPTTTTKTGKRISMRKSCCAHTTHKTQNT